MIPHWRGGGPPAKPALSRGAVGAREQPRPQDFGGVAIAVRCVVRAPPKTSLVVRRAGAAQDESGGGRLSVQSFSTSMGIYVGTSFQRTQGPPATPCPPRSKQRVNGTRIVELQVYGHHFLGAPHASSFCFSGERRRWRHRWRVLPSLVVLGLSLPLVSADVIG